MTIRTGQFQAGTYRRTDRYSDDWTLIETTP